MGKSRFQEKAEKLLEDFIHEKGARISELEKYIFQSRFDETDVSAAEEELKGLKLEHELVKKKAFVFGVWSGYLQAVETFVDMLPEVYEFVDELKPTATDLMNRLVTLVLDLIEAGCSKQNVDRANKLKAEQMRSMYEGYLAAGFSADQAMKLLVAHGDAVMQLLKNNGLSVKKS